MTAFAPLLEKMVTDFNPTWEKISLQPRNYSWDCQQNTGNKPWMSGHSSQTTASHEEQLPLSSTRRRVSNPFLSGQRLPRRGWLGAPCQTLFTLFITRLQGWSFQDVTEKSPGISLSSECSPALIQATGQPQFWQAETGIYSAGRLKE